MASRCRRMGGSISYQQPSTKRGEAQAATPRRLSTTTPASTGRTTRPSGHPILHPPPRPPGPPSSAAATTNAATPSPTPPPAPAAAASPSGHPRPPSTRSSVSAATGKVCSGTRAGRLGRTVPACLPDAPSTNPRELLGHRPCPRERSHWSGSTESPPRVPGQGWTGRDGSVGSTRWTPSQDRRRRR